MTTTVGIDQAKTHLPKLLKHVAKGERIHITNNRIPVAILPPPDPVPHQDLTTIIQGLQEFGKQHTLGDLSLKDLIEEGRM